MSEWQPIETVEEYARVLVYVPKNEDILVLEALACPNGKYYDPTYNEWDGVGATHWMPLPEPPK